MTAPGSNLLQVLFSLLLVIPSSYVLGRVHQWYNHCLRRDTAFRAGYDDASQSMFDLARRRSAAMRPAAARAGREPAAQAVREASGSVSRTEPGNPS